MTPDDANGCLLSFDCVFQSTDCVLNLAFDLVGRAFSFQLGVANSLADGFLGL